MYRYGFVFATILLLSACSSSPHSGYSAGYYDYGSYRPYYVDDFYYPNYSYGYYGFNRYPYRYPKYYTTGYRGKHYKKNHRHNRRHV